MKTFIAVLFLIASQMAGAADDPAWLNAHDLKQVEPPTELSDKALSAQDLNVRAMAYYKTKKLEQAALLFHEACLRDKTHVLAHYNLACTLALLLRKYGPCSGFGLRDIFHPLKTAIDLDRGRIARAQKDKDLSAPEIKKSLAFRLLYLQALNNKKLLQETLRGTEFHLGSFNYTSVLKLEPEGLATWKGSKPDPKAQDMMPPPPVGFAKKGSWSLEGKRLRLKGLGERSGLYSISYEGLTRIRSSKNNSHSAHYDLPAIHEQECGH